MDLTVFAEFYNLTDRPNFGNKLLDSPESGTILVGVTGWLLIELVMFGALFYYIAGRKICFQGIPTKSNPVVLREDVVVCNPSMHRDPMLAV
jgi:hypothetical protein